MKDSIKQQKDPLDGKVIYLMIATILVQFLYPISISESAWVLIAFQVFYISLFVSGIYLVSNNPLQTRILTVATILWLASAACGTAVLRRPNRHSLGCFTRRRTATSPFLRSTWQLR